MIPAKPANIEHTTNAILRLGLLDSFLVLMVRIIQAERSGSHFDKAFRVLCRQDGMSVSVEPDGTVIVE